MSKRKNGFLLPEVLLALMILMLCASLVSSMTFSLKKTASFSISQVLEDVQ